MPLSFFAFLQQLEQEPELAVTVVLTLAVMLVNGWTDAPNAIAGAVVTRALSFSRAVALAAVCNFLGVLCVASVNASVAETVYSIASFSGGPLAASCALCAAMGAIVLWAAAAWWLGIPTSESHALVAGITGAALSLEGDLSCIHWDSWGKVLVGLVLSVTAGYWGGTLGGGWLSRWRWSDWSFRRAQIPGAALTAFLHGAQDGQKFMGVFLLGLVLAQGGRGEETFSIPLWLMLFCAGTMAVGTALGGRRIIDTVGRDMADIGPREGLSADLSSGVCLFWTTMLGLPVSTTHVRTAALLGSARGGGRAVDWGVARNLVLAWVFTFPGCSALGYVMARLFLRMM
ncbi:MAG: inorganic phosphate transporter [Clostridium sp.]|nr:inorganic phosphate transporter [Clostridium sp.]